MAAITIHFNGRSFKFRLRLSHPRVVSRNDAAKIQFFRQIEREKQFFLSPLIKIVWN
jgi:hypothetical protein